MTCRVLHVTFDMRIGGTEMVIKNIIDGFVTEYPHVSCSLFCIEEPVGPWGLNLRKSGIEIASYCRRPGFDWPLIWAIRRVILERQIDILHCHQYTPWIYGLFSSIGTSTKVIFTEHGRFFPDSSSWKRLILNPWFSRLTAVTTAISQATKQALVDFEGIRSEKVMVVYNGIAALHPNEAEAANLRSIIGVDESHFLFGTIARFDPIKNQAMMLRAFAKVARRHSSARLLMVGDGEERLRLEALAEDLAIQDTVIFTGYISEPVNYLALMDVFLLSSLSEGTSMTLLEAMSLGKPCVVTDAGGNSEIIANQVNGLVTKNNDEDAFADAMETILTKPDLRQLFSRQARNRFHDKFSATFMLREYDAIYRRLCSERSTAEA